MNRQRTAPMAPKLIGPSAVREYPMDKVEVGMVLVEGIVLSKSEMQGYVRLETSGALTIVDKADAMAQVLARISSDMVAAILRSKEAGDGTEGS